MNTLLLSLVIDNSSSMKGEKLHLLKQALSHFQLDCKSFNKKFEYAITVFDGLQVKELKSFKDDEINLDDIPDGGLALLGKSILLALENLDKRISELEQAGHGYYKPWFVVLTDGQCYDAIGVPVRKLFETYHDGKITYFPFALSQSPFDDCLDEFKKVKYPLTVANHAYSQLFSWLYETIKLRIDTPIDESIKLSNDAFEGWTAS